MLVPYNEGDTIEVCFCDNGRLIAGQQIGFLKEYAVQDRFSSDGSAYKFYFIKAAREGRLIYRRYRDGLDVRIQYDADKLPYVGLWMNNGTFKGMYNAAVEMCTAPFDAPVHAEKRGYRCSLPPKGILSFRLIFSTEKIKA